MDYLYVAANGDLTVMDMQRVTGSGPTVITAGRSNTKAGGRTVLFPQPFDGGEELEQSSRHVPERAKPQRPLQAVEERGIKRKCRRGHVIAATKQQLLKRIAAADRTHAESVFLPAIGS